MERKIFVLRFVFPFVLLIFCYIFAVKILASCFFGVAHPEPYTLLKFLFSRFLCVAGIDFWPFSFSLPSEYAAEILAAGGAQNVAAETFYLFADSVNYPALYTFFPLYFVGAFALSVVSFCKGLAGGSEEQKHKKQKFLRGVKKISAREFCQKSRRASADAAARVPTRAGELWLSAQRLKEHMLILGSTGTGKSQLLINIVYGLRHNTNARLIFIDRKGEFFGLFGRSDDILFNPFDRRHCGWNIFDEIQVETDADGEFSRVPEDVVTICDTLTQPRDGAGGNPFWHQAASLLLQSCFCYCIKCGNPSIDGLLQILGEKNEKLSSIIYTLPDAMQKGAAVMGTGAQAAGVQATATAAVRQLEPFAGRRGGWSVREWMRGGSGNLYISTAGKNDEAFSSVVSLLVDLIGDEIKEFADAGGQGLKVAFVLDEFGALPRMRTINYLLRESRSKGCSVIIANQTFSRIKAVYGEGVARDIVANCKNRVFFALPEAADAKYISELVGAAEVERETESESDTSGKNSSTSRGRARQIVQDVAFLPAEIASLPTGEAVAALAGLAGFVAKIHFLPAVVSKKRQQEFVSVEKEAVIATEIDVDPEQARGDEVSRKVMEVAENHFLQDEQEPDRQEKKGMQMDF